MTELTASWHERSGSGGVSPVERVEESLARAHRYEGLGAFWSLDPTGAIAQAEQLRPSKKPPALAGEPIAVKDLLDVKGLPTTGGVVGDYPSARSDSEAIRRVRIAGGIPIGKTSMDPLGCTTSGQAPGFLPCLNPVDSRFSPGGSSSGSAVAVAAGVTSLAIGTDTAGSVRIPAAFTGVVGFKPAHAAIPQRGCLPVMPRFDTIGLLAAHVEGCLQGYSVLTGAAEWAQFGPQSDSMRLGVITEFFEEADGNVGSRCEAVLGELGAHRVQLEPFEIGWRAKGLGIVLACELASNWGARVDADPDRYPEIILDTIQFGRSKGSLAYETAMAEIERARARLRRRCSGLTAVVCPTVPISAPDRDREETEISTRFTRVFNALGWPAFSIPAGTDSDGRPIGIQAAAPPSSLEGLVRVSMLLERAAGAFLAGGKTLV